MPPSVRRSGQLIRLVEALQRFHYYLGDAFKVECPTGSGRYLTLWEVAEGLSRRLGNIFTRDGDGRRPVYGHIAKFQYDENWHDLISFHEYFHGDTGAGLGASHQTGWTALVAKLMQQNGEKKSQLADAVTAVAADYTKETNRNENLDAVTTETGHARAATPTISSVSLRNRCKLSAS
ncbi:MAG: hypothetical protein WB555_13775 [Candidatus Korobacteraceae bacterium]